MDLSISSLGKGAVHSPLNLSHTQGDMVFNYVHDREGVWRDIRTADNSILPKEFMQKAGPREKLFFNPKTTTAAIVTCGGLCPGLNNVIRGLVMALHYYYHLDNIWGIPFGYEGLNPEMGHEWKALTPDVVKDINQKGGTILGSSRGAQKVETMVDSLVSKGVDILFTIGGDGTLKGAHALTQEIKSRGLSISVVGIPKTIDNDIELIDHSFGFETSFDVASTIIRDGHNEAAGAMNGIAIIKLMGRDSGFIAASAALAMPAVNFVLIPELPFKLHGKTGFLHYLEQRLIQKKHAVIVVAEGAGQDLFQNDSQTTDASGNVQHRDIGLLLKEEINKFLKPKMSHTIKYIDPSYIVRSAPANAADSVYCSKLAFHAVHGAMAGKTDFVVGLVNNYYVYLPIAAVTQSRKKIDLESDFWFSVLQSTGQPFVMV